MRTKPRPPTLLPHKKYLYFDNKYTDSDTDIAKYLCSVFIDSNETRVRTNENNRQSRVILLEHSTVPSLTIKAQIFRLSAINYKKSFVRGGRQAIAKSHWVPYACQLITI